MTLTSDIEALRPFANGSTEKWMVVDILRQIDSRLQSLETTVRCSHVEPAVYHRWVGMDPAIGALPWVVHCECRQQFAAKTKTDAVISFARHMKACGVAL